MRKLKKYKCPVCGYYTLNSRGWNEICPVCFWEDDDFSIGETMDLDEESLCNGMSINEAKNNYKLLGAVEKDCLNLVRKPMGIELIGSSNEEKLDETNEPYKTNKEINDNAEKYFEEACEIYENYRGDRENKDKRIKAFQIFNALAFRQDIIGFESACYLMNCYVEGFGCHSNYIQTFSIINDMKAIYLDQKTEWEDICIEESSG